MDNIAKGSAVKTLVFIRNSIPRIAIEKRGKTVIINYKKRILVPPYPELKSVALKRKDNLIVPVVNRDFVVQWKANGSNIRLVIIDDTPLAFTRGGFLLDWNVYKELIDSAFIKRATSLLKDHDELVLFGELVGKKSLVRICVKWWNNILGSELEYLVFDIYNQETQRFLPVQEVVNLAREYGLKTPETMWNWTVEELNELLNKFLDICGGEVWEGFVFKNPERGSYQAIGESTLKWRLDETKEYAEKLFPSKLDIMSKKIFDSIRKFIFEGYLDPPVTKNRNEVSNKVWLLREEILGKLEKAKNKNHLDAIIKKLLNALLNELLAEEYLNRKAMLKAIKTFRRIYVFSS